MAQATVGDNKDDGFGAELDAIQEGATVAAKYLPKEAPNDVVAPDLLVFNEHKNHTDRALTDAWFRTYRHLFVNGDGNLHVYNKESGSWSKHDVETKIVANCIQLSDRFYKELFDKRAELEKAKTTGGDVETLTKQIEGIHKMILLCEKSSTISNVAKLVRAKLITVLAAKPHRMNVDDYVIACENGVVDLRTGEVRWPRPTDYITRNTHTVYKSDVDWSWWDVVVTQITSHNPRLKEFLQVWAGYCATGLTREHSMAFWHGKGRNGKNLVIDAIAAALGGYAQSMPSAFLEYTGKDNGSTDNNLIYALAQLDGCRFAYVSETGEKGRMREAMVKSQTGDKTLRARLAHKDYYEFTVTHKLTVASNHKPSVSGTDDGIWSRIRLVPFNTIFGSVAKVEAGIAQHLEDRSLLERVRTDAGKEAILAWIVEGAKKYLAHGLERYLPPEVAAETLGYRREQDVLGQFLQDVSDWVPGPEVARIADLEGGGTNAKAFGRLGHDERLRVEKLELWRVYGQWCDEHGHHAMSSTMFARRITDAQRFWVDEGGVEQLMKPLDVVKSNAAYFYRYIRLSTNGIRLRNMARAAVSAKKPSHSDDEGDRGF